MQISTKLVAGYATITVAILGLATDCPATLDDQSDNGSRIIVLGGNGEHIFPPKSPIYGTYNTKAKTDTQKSKCRWRLLVPIPNKPGKYFQSSPTKAGEWNHLTKLTHKGSVKIKPVTDPKYKGQPRILDTENCAKWEMRS